MLQSSVTFLNENEIVDSSLGDRGFFYGEGFFETMRWVNGRIPLLHYHKKRLFNSCQSFNIDLDEHSLDTVLQRAITQYQSRFTHKSARVKVVVTVPESEFGAYPYDVFSDGTGLAKANIFVRITPFKSPTRDSIELVLSPNNLIESPLLVGLKHLSRFSYIAACKDIKIRPHQQMFFRDSKGNLVDAMHHNLFFIDGSTLNTPKLENAGVEGVCKSFLLHEMARSQGLDVCEVSLKLNDLSNMQEAFITNALTGVTPVTRILALESEKLDITFDQQIKSKKLQAAVENYFTQ